MSCASAGGRSRRPWCYHKRGISLDQLQNDNDVEFLTSQEQDQMLDQMQDQPNNDVCCDGLKDRIGRLLSSEEMSDINFVVSGDLPKQLRIPGHKLIVSLGSNYFRQLFYSSSEESIQEIELPEECSGHVFLEILRYLYQDQILINKENAIQILKFSQKFQIPSLVLKAKQFIRHAINQNNCFVIWLSARQHALKEFESLALKVIETYASHVLLSQDFLRSDLKSIEELLRNDSLRIQEIQLFVALTRWAKHHCLLKGLCPTRTHIKHVLCDSLDLIRFPLMSEQELRTRVHNEGLLEEEVFRSLLSSHRTWPRMIKQFSCQPRAQQLLDSCHLLTVQRFKSFDNQLQNKNTTHCLAFETNKTIFLNAVGVYGPKKGCAFYLQVSLSIVRSDCKEDPTIIDKREEKALLKCDGSQPIINVKFETPFEILANHEYEIIAVVSATSRPTIKSKLSQNLLFYTKREEIQFYYGLKPLFETKLQEIQFSFRDLPQQSSNTLHSAPSTPAPPPRPPPPLEYTRRESRIDKLKRALSFSHKDESHVSCGQIPVLTFFA